MVITFESGVTYSMTHRTSNQSLVKAVMAAVHGGPIRMTFWIAGPGGAHRVELIITEITSFTSSAGNITFKGVIPNGNVFAYVEGTLTETETGNFTVV